MLRNFHNPLASDADFDALFPTATAPEQASVRTALKGCTEGALADTLAEQLDTALPEAWANRLRITDALLSRLLDVTYLHCELQPLLQLLRPALAARALANPSWLLEPTDPARNLLRQWLDNASGWQPDLGRGADNSLRRWREQLASLGPDSDADDWHRVSTDLAQDAEREGQRLQRLEQRLHASERGQLHARRARALAARLINQSLGGRPLPPSIGRFLREEWFQCLQQLLLRHGDGSTEANELNTLTRRLVWTLQPQARDEDQLQELYAAVPEVTERLRHFLAQTLHDAAQREQLLAQIETQHLKQLRGEALSSEPCTLISNDDPILSASVEVSRPLLEQVQRLECGQWFWLAQEDSRIRLSLKLDDTGQLLFVNALGVRAAAYSFEEFAYRLSTREARPQPGGTALDPLLRELLDAAVTQAREHLHRRQEAQREAQERAEAEARPRAEARAKALEEARRQAEHEAQLAAERASASEAAEREAREREQARREQWQTQRGDRSKRERAGRQLASTLDIGTWVAFSDEFGARRQLKLAVKLPSSNKLIFVDRDGGQRLELDRAAFIARLAEGSAELLEQRNAFDDTLAKVVGGLRRRRGEGE